MDFYNELLKRGYEKILHKGMEVSPGNISQAVFDGRVLPSALNKIIIKEDLIETIAFIKETIDLQRDRKTLIELPFVMLGYENEKGEVIIEKIEIDYDKFENSIMSNNEQVANFEGYLTEKINEYAKSSTYKKPVIIHGHTHPSAEKRNVPTEWTNAFSFADMQGYKDLSNSIANFNKLTHKDIQVAGMVVNSAGDFNAVFCDVAHNNMFYKIDNIELENYGKPPSYKGSTMFPEYTERNL